MPRITVVLPVFNHERYIEQALRSLSAQDYTDFQIVAVNDGSTDDSLAILNRHRAHIQVIESIHQGPAAARNQALRATESELVAFMDADDLCRPDRLRLEVERLEHAELDLVASTLSFIDADGNALPGTWTCPDGSARQYWGALLERNWIGTPSVLVRREALNDVGLFDETFTHAEDYDLWLRIGRTRKIGYVEAPLVQCRRHSLNTSMSIGAHQHFERLALQKVNRDEARVAFDQLYLREEQRAEAWIWFLLRRGDSLFKDETLRSLAQHPRSRSLRFALGVFQCDAGEYVEALASFDSLKKTDAAARHNLGVVAARCGDKRAAQSHLNAALEMRPDYYDARYNLDAIQRGEELRLTRRPFREQVVPMVG
jgi:glycosyltransferase involved in cell wall biosynthesis